MYYQYLQNNQLYAYRKVDLITLPVAFEFGTFRLQIFSLSIRFDSFIQTTTVQRLYTDGRTWFLQSSGVSELLNNFNHQLLADLDVSLFCNSSIWYSFEIISSSIRKLRSSMSLSLASSSLFRAFLSDSSLATCKNYDKQRLIIKSSIYNGINGLLHAPPFPIDLDMPTDPFQSVPCLFLALVAPDAFPFLEGPPIAKTKQCRDDLWRLNKVQKLLKNTKISSQIRASLWFDEIIKQHKGLGGARGGGRKDHTNL